MPKCPGLHCPGCSDGGSGLVLPAVAVAAVAGFGTAIATVFADLLTAALVVSSVALVGMVALLAYKWRRDGLWLIQWNKPALPADEPVQAIQWPHASAEVISRRDAPARPAIEE